MSHDWDPDRYLVYADERGRPFVDLLARVGASAPDRVVDLGCGPGNLTALLAQRWPAADVLGVDSSPEMVARAGISAVAGVRVEQGDVRTWRPQRRRSTCCSPTRRYQWVPGHLDLLPGPGRARRARRLVRLPGARQPRRSPATCCCTSWPRTRASPATPTASPGRTPTTPGVYADRLRDLGLEVDAWETTYLHLLAGEDPVFTWISGTGARPDAPGAARATSARCSWRSTRRCCARRTRPARTARRSRSAASSSSPTRHQCSQTRVFPMQE